MKKLSFRALRVSTVALVLSASPLLDAQPRVSDKFSDAVEAARASAKLCGNGRLLLLKIHFTALLTARLHLKEVNNLKVKKFLFPLVQTHS
ncbi:hypothetical protein HZC07_00295 [Candidatus Micrarchaeota archaeon]|nr:hypothetical protein [Candidatus Micrarchaeota archaeon]